jgi:hypothetical protein
MNEWFKRRKTMSRKSFMTLAMLVCLGGRLLLAQSSFNSGSDGSDGALDLTGQQGTVWFYPNTYPGSQQVHAKGIFNWTSITVPAGVTLKLSGFITGTSMPLYFLASGNVNVQGVIDLSGSNGASVTNDVGARVPTAPGPGGYTGGVGGNTASRTLFPGESGSGQGGGRGAGSGGGGGTGGVFSASGYLIPLVGGSGGGGAMSNSGGVWGAGGGSGGGALMIASSTSIAVGGTITADGGLGGTKDYYSAGGGSGGGIRLISNTITGAGTLSAKGGSCSGCGGSNGGPGTVRLEAYSNNFMGTINGNVGRSMPYQLLLPTAGQSTIQVTSINGVPIHANPFQFPDIEINTGSAVPVVIGATQIPPGGSTTVTVTLLTETGDQTITGINGCQLAGTLSSSTCTVQITFPGGGTWGLVKATWR